MTKRMLMWALLLACISESGELLSPAQTVLYGRTNLKINVSTCVSGGTLLSERDICAGPLDKLKNDLYAGGNIRLLPKTLVQGNVTAGGVIVKSHGVRITGHQKQNEPGIVFPDIPEYPDSAGADSIYIGVKRTKTIEAGKYSVIYASPFSTVKLTGGVYHLNRLYVGNAARIVVEGRTIVVVGDKFSFLTKSSVTLSGSSLTPADFLLYVGSSSKNVIGTMSVFRGGAFSVRGTIDVSPRAKIFGGVMAKNLSIGSNCSITYSPVLTYVKNIDTDGDGMPDGWEVVNGLDPVTNDAGGDLDNDDLINIDEYTCGTDPDIFDTDHDKLGDGEEFAYWESRPDGIGWDSDIEPYQTVSGGPSGDGLINILDADSDNDGVLDGDEVHGWSINVNGISIPVSCDPASVDSDSDLVLDGVEHEGWDVILHGTVQHVQTNPSSTDTDHDSLKDQFEKYYGLDPRDSTTFEYMPDLEWWHIMLNIGSWATSPYSAHLDPTSSPMETGILVFEKDFLADVNTEMKTGGLMDLWVYIPANRAGSPVTIRLDFEGADDPNDKFHSVIYGKSNHPEYPGHVNAIKTCPDEGRSISWTISDANVLTEGNWAIQYQYTYDKDIGETPRTIKVRVMYGDNTYAQLPFYCDQPSSNHHSTVRYIETVTGGIRPAFFRGENAIETGTGNSFFDNIKLADYYGNLVRNIGRKAFNGYSFQFPLGIIGHYNPSTNDLTVLNKLVFDWTMDDGLSTRFMTSIDENGSQWSDAQITYDVSYRTSEYESCWGRNGGTGLAGQGIAALGPAVLRRGARFRIIASNQILQTQNASIVIRNRAGNDVTGSFTISQEAGMDYEAYNGTASTWRENWMVEIPTSIAFGTYSISVSAGTWMSSCDMYVIADPYATTIDEDERKAYAYDEDANGWWFGQDSDSPRDTRDRFFTAPLSGTGGLDYELNPFTEAVIKTAILAIDGKTNEIDARNELRIFAAHYIFGAWGFGGGPSNVLYPTPIDITIASSLTSGLTDDMIASKNIPDPLQPRGQCLDFNAVNIAISRAVGFAARFASGQTWIPNVFVDPKYQPSGTKWRYHAWTEGRVENPPTGTDNWYIFDATDNVETQNEGISKSRIDYGTLWDPQRAWIGDKTTIMNAEEVTSSYY